MMRRRPIARTAVNTAVIAGTATAVSGRVARRQAGAAQQQAAAQQAAIDQAAAQQLAAQQAAAAAAAPPPPAAPAAPAAVTGDLVEQLKALGALRDQGILTEEEFAAQKAKILG
jgi:hypothetical protein